MREIARELAGNWQRVSEQHPHTNTKDADYEAMVVQLAHELLGIGSPEIVP